MRKIYLRGLVMLAGSLFLLSSCEKDTVTKTIEKTVPASTDSTTAVGPKVLVVNAVPGQQGLDLGLDINGNQVAEGLGLGETTKYINLNDGNATVKVLSKDGTVAAATSLTLLKQEFYTIVIGLDDKGVKPTITVLNMDPLAFTNDGSLEQLLGAGANPADLFGINFLDLTKGTPGTPGGTNIIGVDYLNEANKVIPGLMALDPNKLSGVVFGNQDVLKDISLLNSPLAYDKLLTELAKQNPGLDFLGLGGILGLVGLEALDGVFHLLDNVVKVLGDLLGGNTGSAVTFYDSVFKDVMLVPGHDYTGILFGDKSNPQMMLIDQTLAGLPKP